MPINAQHLTVASEQGLWTRVRLCIIDSTMVQMICQRCWNNLSDVPHLNGACQGVLPNCRCQHITVNQDHPYHKSSLLHASATCLLIMALITYESIINVQCLLFINLWRLSRLSMRSNVKVRVPIPKFDLFLHSIKTLKISSINIQILVIWIIFMAL
jgi:hypothetical protein